ncbi:sensor histidine kinase [Saccharibacillus sp. CPCC 101409]|uniref:cache domain-containing sensor histidine kinase n=1 Tax=Saccharibacillus sp. CPCC 101409 TaxID=3058041 RepID=UPI00267301C2|nr:sensor histidine kinase [Saccharibacillus sp. CPCC 101409]MDO3411184.1 sensor histidine kinase [Saccharibacillus sp. CPCC 101409]
MRRWSKPVRFFGPFRKSLVPQRLKYRLFAAFVLLILVPFALLNAYNYRQIERLVEEKISRQSREQLVQLNRTLEDQMSIAYKTLIFLEQDSSVRGAMQQPENRSMLDNQDLIEEKFKSLGNSFFLYNPYVYFTLLDFHGHMYTSYPPRKQLQYAPYRERFQRQLDAKPGNAEEKSPSGPDRLYYRWDPRDENNILREVSSSPYLLSLYAYMRAPEGEPYGMARIGIDYSSWFRSALKETPGGQDYFLMTGTGEILARSAEEIGLDDSVIRRIRGGAERSYVTDRESGMLVNYVYIESLDWYMVSRIPLDVLFAEISELKSRYFITFYALTAAFVLFAFMISSAFTRPLSLLQSRMKEAASKNLRVRISEERSRGEVLELTRTFNTMLDDTHELIRRLKAEERQKEAVRVHMLLAQMNPHFLLNTLNTMKWSSIRSGSDDITEMCVSLGKLLEASLDSEVELIYLKDEIELVQAYLHIQRMRYRDAFSVTCLFDEELEYALVPKLSLQPLVENAIRHGVSHLAQRGEISIVVRREKELLVLEVEDNGIGMDESKRLKRSGERQGIGLSNLKERLKLLFRGEGGLETTDLAPGTRVSFRIPFLLSTPYRPAAEPERPIAKEGGREDVDRAAGGG